MNEFIALGTRAREKRDKAIAFDRKEYEATMSKSMLRKAVGVELRKCAFR